MHLLKCLLLCWQQPSKPRSLAVESPRSDPPQLSSLLTSTTCSTPQTTFRTQPKDRQTPASDHGSPISQSTTPRSDLFLALPPSLHPSEHLSSLPDPRASKMSILAIETSTHRALLPRPRRSTRWHGQRLARRLSGNSKAHARANR